MIWPDSGHDGLTENIDLSTRSKMAESTYTAADTITTNKKQANSSGVVVNLLTINEGSIVEKKTRRITLPKRQ